VLRQAHEPVVMALLEDFQTSFLDRFVRPQLADDGHHGAVEMTASGRDDAIAAATFYTEHTLRKLEHPLLSWAYSVLLLGNPTDSVVSRSSPAPSNTAKAPLRVRQTQLMLAGVRPVLVRANGRGTTTRPPHPSPGGAGRFNRSAR